jgi:hypothetical protein
MSRFAVVYEDPEYEQWADEHDEADWEDAKPEDVMNWLVNQLKDYDATYSPFDTINS